MSFIQKIGNNETGRKVFQAVSVLTGLVIGSWFLPKLYPDESYPVPGTELTIYSGSDGLLGHAHEVINITTKDNTVSFNLFSELGHEHDTLGRTYYFELKGSKALMIYTMDENSRKTYLSNDESISGGGHTHRLVVM
jgi:hypothetical protein